MKPQTNRAHVDDENYEKPSLHKQWNEHSSAPVTAKPMTKEDIVMTQHVLAKSYKCSVDDITYTFQKIVDEQDDDAEVCLQITYHIRYRDDDMIRDKVIFSIKVTIPDDLREQAEREKLSRINVSRQRMALPEYEGQKVEDVTPVAHVRRTITVPVRGVKK